MSQVSSPRLVRRNRAQGIVAGHLIAVGGRCRTEEQRDVQDGVPGVRCREAMYGTVRYPWVYWRYTTRVLLLPAPPGVTTAVPPPAPPGVTTAVPPTAPWVYRPSYRTLGIPSLLHCCWCNVPPALLLV